MSTVNEQLKNIWVEAYRPSKIEDMVLSDTMSSFVEEVRRKKEIPHLLFVGGAGVGKTTLAKIIISELDAQYLYINASERNGIDEVRTSILSFAQTKSLDGKLKIIFLDEFDNFTDAGQRALRNVMEEYAANTRFIFTGNYLHRIIEPIQSRCQVFTDFTAPIEKYAKRVVYILKNENVTIPPGQGALIGETIRHFYPDLRRIINFIQRSVNNNILTIPETINNEDFAGEIMDTIVNKGDPIALRKIIIENEQTFGNDYPKLLKDLFNAVYKSVLEADTKRKYMIIVSEYMYRSAFVMDQEINAFAAILALSEITKSSS